MLARAYAEKNDRLRKFLSDKYGHVLREFAKAIAGCLPGLSKEELYWRLDFLSGALTYAMADFGLIKRPSGVSEAAHRAARRAGPDPLRRRRPRAPEHAKPVTSTDQRTCIHMSEKLLVRQVAVLGAGVMGAQIAAHLANANVDTVLFDLPAKEGDAATASSTKAIANLGKLSPAPLAAKACARAHRRRPTTTRTWSCCAAAT